MGEPPTHCQHEESGTPSILYLRLLQRYRESNELDLGGVRSQRMGSVVHSVSQRA